MFQNLDTGPIPTGAEAGMPPILDLLPWWGWLLAIAFQVTVTLWHFKGDRS